MKKNILIIALYICFLLSIPFIILALPFGLCIYLLEKIKDDKNKEICKCKMPYWTIKDLEHCAQCGKLLPDIKDKEK